jgi:hypothetical protein
MTRQAADDRRAALALIAALADHDGQAIDALLGRGWQRNRRAAIAVILARWHAEIPEGQILMHNHVRGPVRRQGWRGFRFWYQVLDDRSEPCPCRWAPELGTHYRIRPDLVGRPAQEDPS